MHTEAHAITHIWCPKRIGRNNEHCIGSQCAYWRWDADPRIERKVYRHSEESKAMNTARFAGGVNTSFDFDGHRWAYSHSSFDDGGEFDVLWRPADGAPRTGFCGAAGRPEGGS